jgi:hypothetical protein
MRARIVVLALVLTPFLASYSQSHGKNNESARHESSAKPKKADDGVQQQGQHEDTDECPAGTAAKSSRKGHGKEGQHEDADEKCAPAPVKAPPPAPVGLAQIHGTTYNDLNGNGRLDFGEPGLAGWTITLAGPVTATTMTAWDGTYAFTKLPVGVYTVCAVAQAGWITTAPKTGPCAGGFGWSLDVPATMPDLWYGSIDFGVKR